MKGKKRRPITSTLEYAINHALSDPNLLILSDGTIWKRVGKPHPRSGARVVAVKVPRGTGTVGADRSFVHIQVKDLVYAKYSGRIPDNFVVLKDNDPNNLSYENLEIADSPYTYRKLRRRRDSLTFDDEREIWELYEEGMNKSEIARKLQTTQPVVAEVIKNGKRK